MKNKQPGLFMSALVMLPGCNAAITSKLVNTSPGALIRTVNHIKIIPASISIITERPDFISNVSIALNRHQVFSDIVSSKGALQLVVNHQTISDHHVSEGVVDAFLRGLIFFISGDKPDEFDYSVIVNADLKYKNEIIASYKTQGSFYSVVPFSSALDSKMQRTTDVVLKSFTHALDLLATKIKRDRNKILLAMK